MGSSELKAHFHAFQTLSRRMEHVREALVCGGGGTAYKRVSVFTNHKASVKTGLSVQQAAILCLQRRLKLESP